MNDKKTSIIIATLAIVLAIGVAISVSSISGGLNGIANAIENYSSQLGGGTRMINGLSTDSTSPSAGEVRTTTLTVTATSTIASSGVPAYYTLGGFDCATVQQPFTTATNTPVYIKNPFSTTATTTFDNILVSATSVGTGFTFDLATTSGSDFATTSSVLAKNIQIASGGSYFGLFSRNTSATTTGVTGGVPTGVLPGITTFGESLWFLRPATKGVMLKIASTSVSNSFTGTVSVNFCKP